jgi:hypothetical protein
MADYSAKHGDTALVCLDTLTYSDGTAANLAGATVHFVMRARSANAVTTDLAASIVSASAGTVSYALTAQDTAVAGLYAQEWVVTFSGGTIEHFPTQGYNTVEIQENLTTVNQSIVELDDIKDYLNFSTTDRTHDGELLRFAAGLTPVVEFIVGPVLPKTYTERYNGGSPVISLRHRPIISVSNVVAVLGPIAYTLTQVPSRDQGVIYGYFFDPAGSIWCTTAGGGLQPFFGGSDSITVTYTAGFVKTPENIRMGMLELIRVNYQQTQQGGGGRIGGGLIMDEEPVTQMLGFTVPNRVREMLGPNRRHPSIA